MYYKDKLLENKILNQIVIFFLIFVIINFSPVFAVDYDTEIALNLSIRERFEFWDGMNARNFGDYEGLGGLNDRILLQRIIFGFRYQIHNDVIINLHLQDSRAFGWSLSNNKHPEAFRVPSYNDTEYYLMNPNEEFLEIYDANIHFNNLIDNLNVCIGRQKISTADGRIFGPGDWGNTGRWTWDAVKLSYKFNKHNSELWFGGTKTHNPTKISIPFTETEYWGVGSYFSIELRDSLFFQPFYAFKKNGSADFIKHQNLNRHWIGARVVDSNFHNFDYEMLFVRQFGCEMTKPISAYGFFARIGFKFSFLLTQPLISLRYTYASGSNQEDKYIRKFDPVFGANDKYYGRMNLLSWSNIDDREIVLELFPIDKLWIELKYNCFRIPVIEGVKILSTLKVPDGKNHLGDEIDLFINYKCNKSFQFTFATGMFFPGDAVLIRNDSKPKNAFWLTLQLLYDLNYNF